MTIIVAYTLIDKPEETDKEFGSVSAVVEWVEGIGQDMFSSFEMSNGNPYVVDSFDELYELSNLIDGIN